MATKEEVLECLEEGGSTPCEGPVGMHTTGDSLKAWPRCDAHQERREERYENSSERYARSDVPPSWFDPTYAGERWDDD